MPAIWNLSSAPPNTGWIQQDIEQFNRMPVWLAEQSTKRIPIWSRFHELFNTIDWQPNMGDVLQGIIKEHSPVTIQQFVPANVVEMPLITQVQHYERSNFARLKRQLFQSPIISFIPSFRDFRTRQLDWASKDLDRQIGVGNDLFVRTQLISNAQYMYVVGAKGDPLQPVPYGEITVNAATGVITDPKNLNGAGNLGINNLLQLIATDGVSSGFPTFRQLCAIRDQLTNELRVPAWEGTSAATPKVNDVLKGTYVLIGEAAIYQGLTYDTAVLNTKNYDRDLLNKPFMGVIGGNINFLEDRWPIRITQDQDGTATGVVGTWYYPAPEIEKIVTPDPGTTNTLYGAGVGPVANTAAKVSREVIPNPAYVNATVGMAIYLGHQPAECIKVGPPPAEFAKQGISMGKFTKLNWNGVVRVTDNILRNFGSGIYDTNKWGDVLQLISDVVYGFIPNTPRYCVPILYFRNNRLALSGTPSVTGV